MEIIDPRIDPRLVPDGSRAIVIAEHQPEYLDLPCVRTPPVVRDNILINEPKVITRWTLTDAERAAVATGADIFVTIISYGAINPLFVTVGPINWKG